MALGAVLGAAFHAFAPRLAPAIAKEGIQSAAARTGGRFIANRLTQYTASQSGQRLVARAAGARFATRLAEHEGTQRAAKYVVSKEVRQRSQGEGQYAPKPEQKTVNVNAGSSTVPRSVNDPSTMNIVSNPNDPVVGLAKDNERYARQQAGRARQRQRGQGPTGWAGTGKGWWEQNDQITQRAAFDQSSVTQLGDFTAARGPTRWAHALGKGLGRGAVARGVGFVEGVRSVEAEEPGPDGRYGKKNPGGGTNVPGKAPAGGTAGTAGQTAPRVNFSTGPGDIQDADVQEHHLTDVRMGGRGTSLEPHPTEGSYVGMGTQIGGTPQPRLSNFDVGAAGELGTSPPAIGPAAPPKPGRPKPGLGDYGRDRFRSMMAGNV